MKGPGHTVPARWIACAAFALTLAFFARALACGMDAAPAVFALLLLICRPTLKARGEELRAKHDAVALHGERAYADALAAGLKGRALLPGDARAFQAYTHILAFKTDAQALAYYSAHTPEFYEGMGNIIILCARGFTADRRASDIFVRSIPALCARRYWQRHWLKSGETTIALVGLGAFGQALLCQGLMVNVTGRPDGICWHIFSRGAPSPDLREMLARFLSVDGSQTGGDAVFFHTEGWRGLQSLPKGANRVIIAMDSDGENAQALDGLAGLGLSGHVDILDVDGLTAQFRGPSPALTIRAFGAAQELYDAEDILHGRGLALARRIYACYMARRPAAQVVWICAHPAPGPGWETLDLFTQSSNFAQADHVPAKVRILLGEGEYPSRPLTARRVREAYAQETGKLGYSSRLNGIEHERWSRWHYLNGWVYADIPQSDGVRRLHPCLKAYGDLTDEDKTRDSHAWEMVSELVTLEQSGQDGPAGV